MSSTENTKVDGREANHHLGGVPPELKEVLTHTERLAHELGRAGLVSLLESQYPYIYELAQATINTVDNTGYAIISTGLGPNKTTEIPIISLAVAAVHGEPTETDKVNRAFVWPVTPRSVEYSVTTFSEDIGEAAMHTDSQFNDIPEDKFLLACVHPDKPGNGTSELIDGHALRNWIASNEPAVSEALLQDYPFRVPTVFTEKLSDDEPEITWRPIFEDDRIRYRYDTIMNAIKLKGVSIPPVQMNAFIRLTELIDRAPKVRHHLLAGEIIVVDNKRMLHARTDFRNYERLLLRVRMNNEN